MLNISLILENWYVPEVWEWDLLPISSRVWRGRAGCVARRTSPLSRISTSMPRRWTRTSCARSVCSRSSAPWISTAATPSANHACRNICSSRNSAPSTASPRTSKTSQLPASFSRSESHSFKSIPTQKHTSSL